MSVIYLLLFLLKRIRGWTAGPSAFTKESSEAKSSLEFDHPAGQGILGPPKVWIGNVRARGVKAEVLQIQNIKGIEKIGLDFQCTSLAEKVRHTELLRNT